MARLTIRHQLAEINAGVGDILDLLEVFMVDQATLDTTIDNLKTAVDSIVAKLDQLETPVDFTSEIGQLQAATDEINTALQAPPAPPAPPA